MKGDISPEKGYSSGNYEKHTTKNPLKKWMVRRFNERLYLYVRKAVSECSSMHTRKTVRILDVGCGEGFIAGILSERLDNVEIIGIERSIEALEMAKKMNPGIAFLQGDIMSLPFEERSFDIVLCLEVLEHLANPELALQPLSRVAGNLVIVSVPNEPWFCLGNLLVLKNVLRLGNPIDHINHWSFRGFKRFLVKNTHVEWTMSKCFPWTIARFSINAGARE